MNFRKEKDSMGEVAVPAGALYGASTQRARDNFPISGIRFARRFIWALGLIKGSAARVNGRHGSIPADLADAIAAAADEVVEGTLDDHFVLDIFQTGSGTSTNTNANEVIANRASQLLGSGKEKVHPNDHVNCGQSSNDVIPSTIHLAAAAAISEDLIPALNQLGSTLEARAAEFADIVKTGRTHLMDATPVTLGQEFGGFAAQIRKGVDRLEKVLPELNELALGGTAVGTGINAPTGFATDVIELLAERTALPLREAANHFEAQGAKDAVVMASGALKTVATSLFKIANDIRWLGSGPTAGLAEINVPDLQPGSSIMPGKVNPVIPEMVMQVAAQVFGNDASITWSAAQGNFELNVMMPVMVHNLLEAIGILSSASRVFAERCIAGITPNELHIRELVERNVSIVTALNPHIGYDNGAKVAKEALATGKSVRQVVLDFGLMSEEDLDKALDLKRMTEGGVL